MQIRAALCLTVIIMLLAACGRPDAGTQPPFASQAAGNDIAQLLQNPPAAGASFELDAYTWRIWSAVDGSLDHDAQGCPIWNGLTTLLSDQPRPWTLPILDGWSWNVGPGYPPDSAPWLVMDRNSGTPYHARIRGHISDPSVAKCSFAKHIFTLEQVVTTYEQIPPDMSEMQVLDTFSSWQRYHDADLGYSFLYPPGWNVEAVAGSSLVAELAVRNPQNPDYPIRIRIHNGETYYDQLDTAHMPPLLQSSEGLPRPFEQDNIRFKGTIDHQHLAGYRTSDNALAHQAGVFFNSSGRTYELLIHYPIGWDASQDLTTTYSFFVLSFQFDLPPGPTPTPPINQQLGTGPFLSQDQLLVLMRQKYGAEATLVSSTLVSEVEARKVLDCNGFQGHPEGVWLLTIHGIANEMFSTIQLVVDATTGVELCGFTEPDSSAPAPFPRRIDTTPIPGTTSTPFSDSYTPVPVVVSPYPAPQHPMVSPYPAPQHPMVSPYPAP